MYACVYDDAERSHEISSHSPAKMPSIMLDASEQTNVARSLALLVRPRIVTSILHKTAEHNEQKCNQDPIVAFSGQADLTCVHAKTWKRQDKSLRRERYLAFMVLVACLIPGRRSACTA